jgi:circadian clock protein KaiC
MDEYAQNVDVLNKESSPRVQTGIVRLDEMLSGGLPSNSTTLVSGTPGSGKSILCFHYVWEGLKNGEKCLFLTSDERVDNIIKQSNKLGFDFVQWMEKDKIKFLYLDIDKNGFYKEIEQEIKSGKYSRVVLDSLTPVTEVPFLVTELREVSPSESETAEIKYPAGSIPATRMHIRRIMNLLNKEDCTSLVTSEVLEDSRNLSRDTISEFLVDGILLLDLDPTMDRRKLTIRKMRATRHTLKPQDITIDEDGIRFV